LTDSTLVLAGFYFTKSLGGPLKAALLFEM